MNYIAIEGADGTGKTTLTKTFVNFLKTKGKTVFGLYEPYGESPVSKKLREFCLDKQYVDEVNWRVREYMLLASRGISTKVVDDFFTVHPDGTVVTDRSVVSGMVYAHVASGMSFDDWETLAKFAFWRLPNIIVHVHVNEQKIDITEGDIYDDESDDFHTKIKKTFPDAIHHLGEVRNFNIVDFENDYNKTPIINAERLYEKLQGVMK
jgi:thymidylate kinase